MREKLIELLDSITVRFHFDAWENTDKIADFLIANGVTIPVQCKECKHQTDGLCPMENYNVPWDVMSDEASCSFGERKDDA